MTKPQASENISDDLERVAEQAGRYTRQVFERTSHMADSAESFTAAIREEPLKASLIALGVGFVLGIIARR